ncbi:hypothetical protein [Spirosoma utsteinense]|uniref:Uncharacterized protein n=1 Tax=Spirosoma utsteinense TaxID=2585773 RepID=A0ABR6W9J5_9BACT|nr:hypothetical protein [Spirosoma utsteinense]MBC3787655.1 hypothetical protein [Spirosoma utsteinense]MBC3793251.1 hypothetical protein [Spirosoma utsteinense]
MCLQERSRHDHQRGGITYPTLTKIVCNSAIERLSGNTNWLTNYLETPTRPAIGLLLGLVGLALFLTWRQEYVRR